MKDYLIREKEVARRLCIGLAKLNEWVKAGHVPPPVRRRPNKAWRSSDIDRYIATAVQSRLEHGL